MPNSVNNQSSYFLSFILNVSKLFIAFLQAQVKFSRRATPSVAGKHDKSMAKLRECNNVMKCNSFILNISIAPLQGDYSGALPIPVRPKRKVFR